MKRHSTSRPCGNLVDGLPHACHTEAIAKLARLGAAKNDTTPPDVNVLLDDLQENPQKSLKININMIKSKKANASDRLMRFQISRNFEKYSFLKK